MGSMSNGKSRDLPDGWERLSDWCIRSPDGLWTICKIGAAKGYVYELWHLKNQIVVNLPSADAAIREHTLRQASSHTSNSSAPAAGPKSSPSQAGVQAELL
jgi:hypothetical protein